jgi:hypothetical protein
LDDRIAEALWSYQKAVETGRRPERREFLDRHADLAKHLEPLLSGGEHADELLGPLRALALGADGSSPEPVAAVTRLLPPGCKFASLPAVPGYDIFEPPVSRGGMGIVYRALRKSTGQLVAFKLIRPDLLAGLSEAEHRKVIERFVTEAQVAAQLEHENIVKVYDVGEVDGWPYYAMRYVEGKSLSALIEDRPLPASRAAAYLEQVACAVHHAHQHAIIHRDLKPNNILIDAKTDRPLVADFGLAKLTDRNQELTRTGDVMGAPAYISPEQARNSAEVTTATDVYGLGATLYAILTGCPPFQGHTPVGTLRKVLEEEPRPPRKINRAVPRDLETICLKCLHKSPAKRYESADALAKDLRHFQAGEPILGRRVGRIETAWRWCKRRPAATALMVAVLCLMAVGPLLYVYDQYRKGQEELRKAEDKRQAQVRKDEEDRQARIRKTLEVTREIEMDLAEADDCVKRYTHLVDKASLGLALSALKRAKSLLDAHESILDPELVTRTRARLMQTGEIQYLVLLDNGQDGPFNPSGKILIVGKIGLALRITPLPNQLNANGGFEEECRVSLIGGRNYEIHVSKNTKVLTGTRPFDGQLRVAVKDMDGIELRSAFRMLEFRPKETGVFRINAFSAGRSGPSALTPGGLPDPLGRLGPAGGGSAPPFGGLPDPLGRLGPFRGASVRPFGRAPDPWTVSRPFGRLRDPLEVPNPHGDSFELVIREQ